MNIHSNYDIVLLLLCSAYLLMEKSRTDVSLALQRCSLKFRWGSASVTSHLVCGDVQPYVDFGKFPRKSIRTQVALEDMGRGDNWKALLCATVTQPLSAVCVLKYDNEGTTDMNL
jgi:hypothetical protein